MASGKVRLVLPIVLLRSKECTSEEVTRGFLRDPKTLTIRLSCIFTEGLVHRSSRQKGAIRNTLKSSSMLSFGTTWGRKVIQRAR